MREYGHCMTLRFCRKNNRQNDKNNACRIWWPSVYNVENKLEHNRFINEIFKNKNTTCTADEKKLRVISKNMFEITTLYIVKGV